MRKSGWTCLLVLLLVEACGDRGIAHGGIADRATLEEFGSLLGPDIALSAGIQEWSTRTRGVAPADYDLDGDIDLFLANTVDSSRFYWNMGTDSSGYVVFRRGRALLGGERAYVAAPADYDNDGDPDLFVGIGGVGGVGLDHLFQNVDGEFKDVAQVAGIAGPIDHSGQVISTATSGGAWGDYDNDGWLDLYVTTLITAGTLPQLRGRNTLYRNLGDGRFEDMTDVAGVGDTRPGWAAS